MQDIVWGEPELTSGGFRGGYGVAKEATAISVTVCNAKGDCPTE